MATIHYLSPGAKLPSDGQYVLVEYGSENRLFKHSRGFTMTVDRSMEANLLEAHTETVIGEAEAMADLEKIDTVFVTAPKRGGAPRLAAVPKTVAPNER